jgi:hypothetical protein
MSIHLRVSHAGASDLCSSAQCDVDSPPLPYVCMIIHLRVSHACTFYLGSSA